MRGIGLPDATQTMPEYILKLSGYRMET